MRGSSESSLVTGRRKSEAGVERDHTAVVWFGQSLEVTEASCLPPRISCLSPIEHAQLSLPARYAHNTSICAPLTYKTGCADPHHFNSFLLLPTFLSRL
jgi:hypothetical protein